MEFGNSVEWFGGAEGEDGFGSDSSGFTTAPRRGRSKFQVFGMRMVNSMRFHSPFESASTFVPRSLLACLLPLCLLSFASEGHTQDAEDGSDCEERLAEIKAKFESEKSKEPYERLATITSFSKAPCKATVRFLHSLYTSERTPLIWTAVAQALGGIGSESAAKVLLSVGVFKPKDEYTRGELLKALRADWEPDAAAWLLKGALNPKTRADPAVHLIVVKALTRLKDKKRFDVFAKELGKTQDAAVLVELIEALREEASPKTAKQVSKYLRHPNVEVQIAVYDYLEPVATKKQRKVFENGLESKSWEIRAVCVEALGRIQSQGSVKLVSPLLEDPNKYVRISAVQMLLNVGGKAVIEPLYKALDGAEGRVQDDIADALARLTGKDFGPASAQWESWWAVNRKKNLKLQAMSPAALSALKAKEADKNTQLLLYHGLRVLSDRTAFLFDCSESMDEPYVPAEERKGDKRNPGSSRTGRTAVDPDSKKPDGKGGKGGAKAGKGDRERRIDVAQRALLGVLKGLKDTQRVNVLRFDTLVADFILNELQSQERKLVPLDKETRKRLEVFIKKANPGGQTNFSGSLRSIFRYEDVDTIYLLSDGAPTAGETDREELLKLISRWNRRRRVRINTIGFDLKPDAKKLMIDIAAKNYGVFVER